MDLSSRAPQHGHRRHHAKTEIGLDHIVSTFRPLQKRGDYHRSLEELQADLDEWLAFYNNERTHQGKMCCGRTPMQTLLDGKEAWHDKITTLND
jgi:hypothetical protein